MKTYNCSVYLLTFPDNKFYVGITTRKVKIRLKEHKFSSRKTKKDIAIKKFGSKNIKLTILKNDISLELAKKYEIYYIKKYNSQQDGYNSTKGGEGLFGYKFTKEQCIKRGLLHKGKTKSEEYKKKHSLILKEYYKNNPEKSKKSTENILNYRKNNPEKAKENCKKGLNKYEVRLKNSRRNGGKPILVYDLNDNFIGRWEIISDCARELKLSVCKICLCLKKLRNKHRGYKFYYA